MIMLRIVLTMLRRNVVHMFLIPVNDHSLLVSCLVADQIMNAQSNLVHLGRDPGIVICLAFRCFPSWFPAWFLACRHQLQVDQIFQVNIILIVGCSGRLKFFTHWETCLHSTEVELVSEVPLQISATRASKHKRSPWNLSRWIACVCLSAPSSVTWMVASPV